MTSHDSFEVSAQTLIDLLIRIMQRSVHRNTLDASRGEMGLIVLLHQYPDGLTAGEIGEKLGISSSGVANVLKQLEKKELVVRKTSIHDRRRTITFITEKGKALALAHCQLLKSDMADVLQRLGQEDTDTLIRIFQKLLSAEEMHSRIS